MTLKEIRKNKGILAKKVAEILGLSYRQYLRVEASMTEIDKIKLEKLSQFYNMDISELEISWREGKRKNERCN